MENRDKSDKRKAGKVLICIILIRVHCLYKATILSIDGLFGLCYHFTLHSTSHNGNPAELIKSHRE